MTTTTAGSTDIKAVLQEDPNSNKLTLTRLPPPLFDPAGTSALVRVYAASPCKSELSWEANFPSLFPAGRLRVPGTEGAGTVEQAPDGSSFNAGDEVFFRIHASIPGALREVTLVPLSMLAQKPAGLSWTDAAATPLSSLTAYQGLFAQAPGVLDPAALSADAGTAAKAKAHNAARSVLVTGASGGVGSWAIKLAAAAGVGRIVGVGSASKADTVRGYGATEAVAYNDDGVARWAQSAVPVDLILDAAGSDLDKVWPALKTNGTFLSVCVDPNATKPADKAVTKAAWFLVEPSGKDLTEIARLMALHSWTPLVDSVVKFEDVQAAYEKTDGGRTNGKVVVTVP
ncbi:putative zinc-binding oxidoreductase, mitochondrial [Vanrija pseudolonga]|uniref:Zinc-binding oxidoreductase, mitochondrial n=1 Tax=Vanrija pseudolonga TaxID=143232 RepID=A0AAF0YAA7_9TREE|nr:putative zinc-binding oxidoreductase, mitochondrial [Vanrija pseudolonga]